SKFAETMKSWSEKLKKWSAIISGAEAVAAGIKAHDPLAALQGAFETASAATGGDKTTTGKNLGKGAAIAGLAHAAKNALHGKPPDYAAVAEAALGIADELHKDKRFEDASKIIGAANGLKRALASKDPAALA